MEKKLNLNLDIKKLLEDCEGDGMSKKDRAILTTNLLKQRIKGW